MRIQTNPVLGHTPYMINPSGSGNSRETPGSIDFPGPSFLLAATLFGFLKSVEQASCVGTGQRFEPVRLTQLDGIARDRPGRAEEFGFLLHLWMPHVFVILTNVHEDAHFRNSVEFGRAGLPHISRECGDRQEVLRVRSRDVEGGDSAVGWSGDMKFVVLDLVILQDHREKLRENASSVLEEQLSVRRGWSYHDVAPLFSLRAEVAVENTVHRVHRLWTSAEDEDRWISLRWIVSAGKNDFISDCGTTHLLGFLQQLRLNGLDCEHRDDYRGKQRPPLRLWLMHMGACAL